MEHIIDGLNQASAAGIQTVVDATTLDLGRDVNVLAEASRRTGINIIACTGWWTEKPRFISGRRWSAWPERSSRMWNRGYPERASRPAY